MPDEMMKTFDVTVMAREGAADTRPAQLLCCAHCNDGPDIPTVFIVYSISGHLHLQCATCNETFCRAGGACE